ncbi:MAG: trigger factor [Kiritimatiellae bacterium]|jgi:trigger factor|nr:trigger factor [Kiritimatiellia bacterium]
MSVEITETKGCRRTLNITVPAEDVKNEYSNAISMYKKKVVIPGFRKGKATTKVVEQKFGADLIKDVEQQLIGDAYRKSVDEKELKVVTPIEIKDTVCSLEDGLTFTAVVDVEPEFKMPKYDKISLKPNVAKVDEKEIDTMYDTIIASRAAYNKVEARPAKKEDFMRVSFEGTLNGKPLSELGDAVKRISTRENFWILPEMKDVVPGLDTEMIGVSLDETKDVTITFPKDYAIKEVAGKKVDYKVTLTDLQERVLPEITEEFLESLQVKSVEELRERIKEDIQQRNEGKDHARLIQEIVDYLDKHTKLELPESMVAMEIRQRLQQAVSSFMQQGQTEDNIKDHQEEILKKCEEEGKRAVKLSFILMQVAIDKALEVADEEVEMNIMQMAMQRQMTPEDYKEKVLGGETENVKENILCNKALNAIKDEVLAK